MLTKVLIDTAEIESTAHRAFASRCRIYDLDAKIKAQEAVIPPNQRPNSPELAKLREELNAARAEYAASEARLEALKARHAGAVALANLLAAMVQAEKDTSQLEAAIAEALGETAQEQKPAQEAQAQQGQPAQARPNGQPAPAQNAQGDGQKADGAASGTFKVLEVRESKPGVVRAYCEGPNGKVAVFAKNGNAQTLAGAVGRQVEVKYRQGEKGLIALSVSLAG